MKAGRVLRGFTRTSKFYGSVFGNLRLNSVAAEGHVCVSELFVSIQGESTWAGLTCFFIRLSGCNLRCKYCDTTYAYKPGKDMAIADVVKEAIRSKAAIVEITGGEPLLQPGFAGLATKLRDKTAKPVLVETNGSLDISAIPDGVIAIMDVKCPGSSEDAAMDLKNIKRLRPEDEVKFVLSNLRDYNWAKKFVVKHDLASRCKAVLFSPVSGVLDAKKLCGWIVRDRLPVRFQMQLHNMLGIK
jgi:7-carboxy-7-deazaguanine synthase